MSDKSFTFFELHFHDGFQFGPKTLDGIGDAKNASNEGGESEPALDTGDEEAGDSDDQSGCLGCKLIGLGVLAAAAYAIRKLLGSGTNGLDALDDIEELEEFGAGESGEADANAYSDGTDEEDDAVAIEVTSGDESTSGSNTGLLVAAAVALLLLVAVAAKKLLGGDMEEIEVPDELAEE